MYQDSKIKTQEKVSLDTNTEPTAADKADLLRFERVIARGLKECVSVLLALLEIHRRNLYRGPDYLSWPDYVHKRWGFKRSRAYQIVEHAKVVHDLLGDADAEKSTMVDFSSGDDRHDDRPTPPPVNERVARELSTLNTAEERREVFKRAKQHSQSGRPTARDVQEARDGYFAEMASSATAEIEDEEEDLITRAKQHDPDDRDTRCIKKGIREVEKAVRFWGHVPRMKEQVKRLERELEEARKKV